MIWFFDEYEIYSYIILSFSALTISATLFEARKNYSHLKKMADSDTKVNVFRGLNKYDPLINKNNEPLQTYKQEIFSSNLVQGDLIQIQDNQVIPCDLILLNGNILQTLFI